MINQVALIFWNIIFPHCPLLTLHKNIAHNIEYFGSYSPIKKMTNRKTYRPRRKNVGTGHFPLLVSNFV